MRIHRLFFLILVLLGLVAVGTLGYYTIEKEYTLFDALYMAVITLTTVGYGEIPYPLSTAGRVFTIFLLLLTTAAFFRFNNGPTIKSLLLLCGSFALAAASDWPAFYLVPLATIYFLLRHKLNHWPKISLAAQV